MKHIFSGNSWSEIYSSKSFSCYYILMKGDKNSDTILKRLWKQWYNQIIKLGPEMRQKYIEICLYHLLVMLLWALVFLSLKHIIIISFS